MEYLHMDTWGPARVPSYGGARWLYTITDAKSKMSWVFFTKTKSAYERFRCFEEFRARYENLTGRKIKYIRVNNGSEFLGIFSEKLKQWAIKVDETVIHTPEQNGVVERLNGTLLETARALL